MRFYGGKALDEVPQKEVEVKEKIPRSLTWQLLAIPFLVIRKQINLLYYKLLDHEEY